MIAKQQLPVHRQQHGSYGAAVDLHSHINQQNGAATFQFDSISKTKYLQQINIFLERKGKQFEFAS